MNNKRAHGAGAVRIFFALAFVVFTCVFPYIATINNPNENTRVYMTMAIVEEHSFRIDEIVQRHGWTNDMARVPAKEDPTATHLYSVKGPAISYAGVPIYWAMTKLAPRFGHPVPTVASTPQERAGWLAAAILVLRLFTVQIPCFVFLVWFERYLRAVSSDVILRLAAVAAAGLGTNYLAYSLMYASHALFACTAFASFAITTRERSLYPRGKRRRASRAFLAGLFAGLSTLLEYHGLPLSLGLSIYALTTFGRPKHLFAFAAGGAICAGALMFFQWRSFGNPLTPGHKFCETESFRAVVSTGVFGIGAPNLISLRELTMNRGFGFFGMSPFMWLGLLAIPFGMFIGPRVTVKRWAPRRATIAWLTLMAVFFVVVSGANNWRAGWTLGPRYLGAAPPFFAFGAVCALEHLARRGSTFRTLGRGVAAGLAGASLLQSGFVAIVYNTLPEEVSRPLLEFAIPLARTGFVPHHLGELFGWTGSAFWYVVAGSLIAAALVAALWRAGDSVPRWLARVTLTAVVFVLAIRPALTLPQAADTICTNGNQCGSNATGTLHFFTSIWEPASRDRITLLRRRIGKQPGDWLEMARLERILGRTAEADADAARASDSKSGKSGKL